MLECIVRTLNLNSSRMQERWFLSFKLNYKQNIWQNNNIWGLNFRNNYSCTKKTYYDHFLMNINLNKLRKEEYFIIGLRQPLNKEESNKG